MVYYDTLGMIITSRCGNGCDICCTDSKTSGPEIPLDSAKKCIAQAYESGIRTLFITGGEPTVRADIFDVIGYAKSKGMDCGLVTSANYAISKKVGMKYGTMFKNAGLDSLHVSVDADHNKSVPESNYVNAIKGARKAGIGVGLGVTVRKSTVKKTKRLLNTLSLHLLGRLHYESYDKYDGSKFIVEKTPDMIKTLLGPGIPIKYGYAYNSGRARNLGREELLWSKPDAHGSCEHSLLVSASGEILSCGNSAAVENERYYSFGNIRDTDIGTAIEKIKKSPMGAILEEYGSSRMKWIVEHSEDPQVRKLANEDCTSFCDFCTKVLSNEKSRELVFSRVGKTRV
jgi:MoaA/NifB/PqqE/SkfB family radical SAM enzyme